MSGELMNGGSMDDMNAQDIRLAMLYHDGPSMGQVIISSVEGDAVTTSDITFDHQAVGAALNPDGNRGLFQADAALYDSLSPSQEALLKRLRAAASDPEIDLT